MIHDLAFKVHISLLCLTAFEISFRKGESETPANCIISATTHQSYIYFLKSIRHVKVNGFVAYQVLAGTLQIYTVHKKAHRMQV